MSIEPGQQLSHYRIVEKIGEGGMGVVWKAEDTVLHREVALKFLPEGFDNEPDRLARFEREARFVAALNHANIAAIHGFEQADGMRFLVLELVDGTSLAERIDRRSLPLREGLRICCDIARALEAAHDKGVIHRDLKPDNVRLTPEGIAKVLDFGLAKALAPEAEAGERAVQATMTMGTAEHTIMGTAPYMSPEQASGGQLDKRTDIWAFGCILYEVLTGERAFMGATVSDTITAIHGRHPDWSKLPAETPQTLRRLLLRCMAKERDRRLRDIGDARLEIEDALEPLTDSGASAASLAGNQTTTPGLAASTTGSLTGSAIGSTTGSGIGSTIAPTTATTPGSTTSPSPRRTMILWAAIAGLALGAALTAAFLATGTAETASSATGQIRADLAMPVDQTLHYWDTTAIGISPDGSRVVFTLLDPSGKTRFFLRVLDSTDGVPLPGAEEARGPFFSPDGEWVGYFHYATQRLMKIPVQGGAPVDICHAMEYGRGASWGPDGRIVFTQGYGTALSIVSAAGGESRALTQLREGDKSHRYPQVLPDGKSVLFTIGSLTMPSYNDATIAIADIETGAITSLFDGGSYARYSPTGHIVYAREGALYKVAFDLASRSVRGAAVKMLDRVMTLPSTGVAHFAFSDNGTLVYGEGGDATPMYRIVEHDRAGGVTRLPVPPAAYARAIYSPDGSKLTVSKEEANSTIWIYDIERDTMWMTGEVHGDRENPVWTPDGLSLIYSSTVPGRNGLLRMPVDAPGEEMLVYSTTQGAMASQVIDNVLLFAEADITTGFDIKSVLLDAPDQVQTLFGSNALEYGPQVSPDGHWLAYVSTESGRPQVYVTSYPELQGRQQVSNAGGENPLWAGDGSELFYIDDKRVMSATVNTGATFSSSRPQLLFELEKAPWLPRVSLVGLSRDGQGFLALEEVETLAPTKLRLVVGWDVTQGGE